MKVIPICKNCDHASSEHESWFRSGKCKLCKCHDLVEMTEEEFFKDKKSMVQKYD